MPSFNDCLLKNIIHIVVWTKRLKCPTLTQHRDRPIKSWLFSSKPDRSWSYRTNTVCLKLWHAEVIRSHHFMRHVTVIRATTSVLWFAGFPLLTWIKPGRCQAIIWTIAEILSIQPVGTKFSEMLYCAPSGARCIEKQYLQEIIDSLSNWYSANFSKLLIKYTW